MVLYPQNIKNNPQMVSSFTALVKSILKSLPPHDYPVLNSRLFFNIWLNFVLDSNLTSMRSLFYRLNHTGIEIDISTFSKACKSREDTRFYRVYYELIQKIKKKRPVEAMNLMAIDSTVITLTSKLFWQQKYHQVKLINGREISSGNLTECLINFGQEHDAKFKEQVMTMIPDGAVAIMDRGFASWEFIEEMSKTETRFVVRIKNNMKTQFNHQRYRVVCFHDPETQTEYRLATNLKEMTDEEVSEIYRKRWDIEILWKFLKMHLKLDHLITKNIPGVRLQILMSLIAYLILKLMEIHEFYGNTLLDKFRYLQLKLSQKCSLIHWSYDWLPETLV